ncbi:tetratricopeptide repeat protein [Saccharothrix xinjiangensis]|uniref:ATP-binding protein n=1 Tax=Saccharothrix xinjiangensis TaxID=204798 RepID=A0ABV9Y6Y4_9PSEU
MAGEPEVHPEVHNEVGGQVAAGRVVQARTITGGVRETAQHARVSGDADIRQSGRDQYNIGGDVHVHPSRPAVVPRQLPPAPRWFTGRADELAALTAALDEAAGSDGPVVISSIGGAGGIGKTWLALCWAHRHADRFPDGQLFVDLRGFAPGGTPMTRTEAVRGFLDALGVEPRSIPVDPEAQVGRYRSLVAGKRLLVVLDNARDASQVTGLLPGSPTCAVLITSRDRMEGLAIAHGARQLTVGVLDEADTRVLLARRLGQARVDAEPEAVAELLGWCAGLPLASSVVAGRAATRPDFPLAALAAELRDAATRLGALDTGDPRTAVEVVLSWSCAVLTDQQASVFGLLGSAPGPDIGLEAAACLADLPVPHARAVLRALGRVSLVDEHTPGRYRMHDLTRLFATGEAHRDLPSRDREAALRRLVGFYLHTAHAADELLNPHGEDRIELGQPEAGCHPRPLADDAAASAWFDAEHLNVIAAQQLAVERGWDDAVWQLAWTLNLFHVLRGHQLDNIASWRRALAAADRRADAAARARARALLGYACAVGGLHTEALDHLPRALALVEQGGDLRKQAHVHFAFAVARGKRGDDRRALEHALRALDLYQVVQDPVGAAEALQQAGSCATRLGHHDQARRHLEAALALCHHIHPIGAAMALDGLGHLAHRTGRHDEAVDHYRRALTLYRETGGTYESANTLDRLGHAHVALDRHDLARRPWEQALHLYRAQLRDADADRVRRQLDALDEPSGATGR